MDEGERLIRIAGTAGVGVHAVHEQFVVAERAVVVLHAHARDADLVRGVGVH